jgi:hypothetical protein
MARERPRREDERNSRYVPHEKGGTWGGGWQNMEVYLHGRVHFFVLVNGALVFADVLLERLDLLRRVTRPCTFARSMTK